MSRPSLVIIGGGLAGLSTGCYALANGWATTILEHNISLGGVCAAWRRGPYLVDGCIHWLTGGAFSRIYAELGIIPPVAIRTLDHFATIVDAEGAWEVPVTRDLPALAGRLRALSPADGEAIDALFTAIDAVAGIAPPIDHPPEITSAFDQLRSLWEGRHEIALLVRYRGTIAAWLDEHVQSPVIRRVLTSLVPEDAPVFFLMMMLGYLGRGWLSRPVGGTEAFRDALVERYRALGGESRLDATVDEVLVRDGRAEGVRLGDGTIVRGDAVVSTSSAPETVLRLLGGRYGRDALDHRLERWKLFEPIILASFGVARPLADAPSTLTIDGLRGVELAGRKVDRLTLRIYNDDPAFAPPGHTVVQALLSTDYDWWATRGSAYGDARDRVGDRILELLEPRFPGLTGDVRMRDVATPLTFWRSARSWRGAFEGWMPSASNFTQHVAKTLPGLDQFYMAGQWVEPGGGVPTALMSGRQLVQILCDGAGKPFVTPAPPSAG
jgi:phytoene desaturase